MIREIARREVVTRIRSRAFKVTTAVIAVLTVAFVVGAVLLGDGDDGPTSIDIAVADDAGVDVERLRESLDTLVTEDLEPTLDEVARSDLASTVEDGDADVGIRDRRTLVWSDEPDPLVRSLVAEALTRVEIDARAEELGVGSDELALLLAPIELATERLDPPSDSESARTFVATLSILLMFFAIQGYGSQIALVVVEEKSNRIVEILLALVRPRSLLAGKVAGVGVLAAVQLLIPLAGMAAALALSDFADIPASAFASLPLLFVVFVLGFTLYGTLFALVGSLVSRQEDAQQALVPVFVPIFLGYVLGFQAVAAPDSTLSTVVSIVPFTSPFALPVTVAQDASSIPIVAISLTLLIVTTIVILRLAARVYEFTLLRTGSRIPLREAVRLARADA